jgi:hypothetical protein
MGYWVFRTPSEVIKTNVQNRQSPAVKFAIDEALAERDGLDNLSICHLVCNLLHQILSHKNPVHITILSF